MIAKGWSNVTQTAQRYDRFTIGVHWVFAASLSAAILLGFLATRIPSLGARPGLLVVHIALGGLAAGSGLIRIGWWLRGKRQLESASPPGWQRVTQRVIYVLMTVLPLVAVGNGTAMLVDSGLGITKSIVVEGPHVGHLVGALVLMALVGVHLGSLGYHERKLGEPVAIRMGLPDRSQ